MARTQFTAAEIASGESNTSILWNKIKDNDDDHQTRIVSLEGGSAVAYIPLDFSFTGDYSSYPTFLDLERRRVNFDLKILGVRLHIITAGPSGTTEVDVLFKRGVAAFVSILSTKPSVGFAAGDETTSSNAILDASKVDLLAADLIRVDLTSTQNDGASGFLVSVDFEKS